MNNNHSNGYHPRQRAVCDGWYCFHFVSLCVCVSTWQNMVLETPTVAGNNTETVLSALPGDYISVSLWTYIVTKIASQPCEMQS